MSLYFELRELCNDQNIVIDNQLVYAANKIFETSLERLPDEEIDEKIARLRTEKVGKYNAVYITNLNDDINSLEIIKSNRARICAIYSLHRVWKDQRVEPTDREWIEIGKIANQDPDLIEGIVKIMRQELNFPKEQTQTVDGTVDLYIAFQMKQLIARKLSLDPEAEDVSADCKSIYALAREILAKSTLQNKDNIDVKVGAIALAIQFLYDDPLPFAQIMYSIAPPWTPAQPKMKLNLLKSIDYSIPLIANLPM